MSVLVDLHLNLAIVAVDEVAKHVLLLLGRLLCNAECSRLRDETDSALIDEVIEVFSHCVVASVIDHASDVTMICATSARLATILLLAEVKHRAVRKKVSGLTEIPCSTELVLGILEELLALVSGTEHRLSLHHGLLHLRSHINGMPTIRVLKVWESQVGNLHSPPLAVLVHPVHKFLVIEVTHAFATDTKTLAF